MQNSMKEENNHLIKSFLERTFFSAWKNPTCTEEKYQNYKSLELQVNALCDLDCKYCYYAKFKKDLYPAKISKSSLVLKNLDIVLDWLEQNKYYPEIEIFSGEPFFQEVGFQSLEKILNWQIKNKVTNTIMIPTNFSFIWDEKKIDRIESLIERAKQNNIRIFLSCSVDGKYCDKNRPYIDGRIRSDEYYNRMFEFCKKWDFGFHPMIYNEEIEHWKDNWLWFQENFEKYKISFSRIYLLEVRNGEWTKKQLQEFYKFIRFIINWTYNHLKDIVPLEAFPQCTFENRLFNIFQMFSTVGRGLGCSAQSTIQLRLGDLTTSVCHRAAYKPHELWKFVTKDDKIVDIESLNHNLAISVAALDTKNLPFCETCTIREFCTGQCLGASVEINSDPFLVIPTVCALEHAKVSAILDELWDLGLWHHYYDWTILPKQRSMKLYYNYFKGENNDI